jgi:hypothetical protein
VAFNSNPHETFWSALDTIDFPVSSFQLTARFASERYGVSVAPEGLRFVQELANSISHDRPPAASDLLDEVFDCQTWLDEVVAEWIDIHGIPKPDISLDAKKVVQLRSLRTALRKLIQGNESGQRSAFSGLELKIGDDASSLIPSGSGVAWLKRALAIEWILAQQSGDVARLKLCRNTSCAVAFYDHSKNNSRVWHDVARCGNAANVRAYRARQQSDADLAEGLS